MEESSSAGVDKPDWSWLVCVECVVDRDNATTSFTQAKQGECQGVFCYSCDDSCSVNGAEATSYVVQSKRGSSALFGKATSSVGTQTSTPAKTFATLWFTPQSDPVGWKACDQCYGAVKGEKEHGSGACCCAL